MCLAQGPQCSDTGEVTYTVTFILTSAYNLYKLCASRSGPTERRAWSGSKLFDTLVVLLKYFLEKVKKLIFKQVNSMKAKS